MCPAYPGTWFVPAVAQFIPTVVPNDSGAPKPSGCRNNQSRLAEVRPSTYYKPVCLLQGTFWVKSLPYELSAKLPLYFVPVGCGTAREFTDIPRQQPPTRGTFKTTANRTLTTRIRNLCRHDDSYAVMGVMESFSRERATVLDEHLASAAVFSHSCSHSCSWQSN